MSYRDRSRREPVMPRIIKLEVSEKNMRGRLIAVVVLLAIAFTAIGVAVKDAFTTDPGWKVMDCYAEIVTYSDDLVFKKFNHIRNFKACVKGALIGLGVIAAVIVFFALMLLIATL